MANPLDEPEQNNPTAPSDAGTRGPRSRPLRARDARRHLRAQDQQWRDEFPYHWRADDLVTRRDTLRFLAAGSGALFVATGALAVAGNLAPPAAARAVRIVGLNELPVNTAKVFTFPDQYAQGILINLPGKGFVAYSDVCTHLSCAVIYTGDGKHLHCPCHEGLFDAATGDVIAGPPTRPLPLIQIETRADGIYALREIER